MATTTTDPVLGRLVDGRYEIVARVARGGMATVYRARDRRLDREVAVKIMHPHLADGVDGASFVSRFRREARASARLSHPGVVSVFDQGVDGDTSYLTMEFVAGHNLRADLHRGPLPVGRALDVAAQVLEALAAAHRVGLVHRDVKPENVLISDDGPVKVADFGLARAVTEVTSTATGTILGTVAYLAPEVITSGGCSPATDVYAVGVLLHEMITGVLPYPGETPVQVAFRHVHEDLPAPSAHVDWLPGAVDDLVAAFTARSADQRPAHAGAALAALLAARAGLDADVLERVADPAGRPVPAPDGGATTTGAGSASSPEEVDDLQAQDSADAVDEIPASFFAEMSPDGHDTEHLVTAPTQALEDTARPDGGHRRRRRAVAMLSALVLLLSSGFGGWWWFTDGPGAWTTVPAALVGQPADDATKTLGLQELRSEMTDAYDDEVPAGHVVSTDPSPGDDVRRDGVVTLVVSLGVEMLTVPGELVGLDRSEASAAVRTAGFEDVETDTAYDDDAPEGQVLETSVPEGSVQRHDTTVTLTVSDGPAPVLVPQVSGRSKDEAEKDLQEAGLAVEYTDPEHSLEVDEGRVLSQTPEEGTEAHRTDTVTLTLSAGPRDIQVPDVVGMSEQEATDALTAEGFEVDVNRYLGGLLDTVRFQDTEGEAPEGSTVTLTVW